MGTEAPDGRAAPPSPAGAPDAATAGPSAPASASASASAPASVPGRRARRRRRGPDPLSARRARALEAAAEVGLGAVLVVAPQLIGSVPTWAVGVDLALAAGTFALVLAGRHLAGAKVRLPGLVWVLVGALVLEALQLVPLPPAVLRLLSPKAAAVDAFVLPLVHGWPAWRPLSLDPFQTGLDWARHLTAVLVLVTVVTLADRRRRRRRLTAILAASALVAVALAFVQRLVGLDHIYGVWPRAISGTWVFAAFVNPNHFGAYLDLLAPVSLGLALSTEDRSRAALWGLAFVLAGGTALLTLSRGAIVALLAGLTVFIALRRRDTAPAGADDQRPRFVPGADAAAGSPAGPEGPDAPGRPPAPGPRRPPLRQRALTRMAAPLLVGAALSVAAYLALDPILDQVATLTSKRSLEHEERWKMWGETLPLIRDFWLTGVGAGAYRVVFPMYKRIPAETTFEHPENQYLELPASLGVPAALAVLAALGWLLLGVVRRRDLRPRELGLLAGVVALAVHEGADFATAFGGVALPAAAALGLLVVAARAGAGSEAGAGAGTDRDRHRRRPRLPRRLAPLPVTAAFSVALLGGVVGVARASGHLANETLGRIDQALAGGAHVDTAVAAAVRARPSDHMPPLVAADTLLRRGHHPARAMAWVTRAMYLAPTEPRAHLLAALLLTEAGHKDQALLELRLAARDGHPLGRVLDLAAASFPDLADLRRAVPDDPAAQRTLMGFLLARRRPDDAWTVGQALRARDPDDPALLALLGQAALAAKRPDDAEALGRTLIRLAPTRPEGALLVAQARTQRRDDKGAAEALRAGLTRAHGDPQLAMTLAGLYLGPLRDPKAARSVLDAMRLPTSDGARSRLQSLLGRAAFEQGRTRQALDRYHTAARLAPWDPGPLTRVGDILMGLDQYARALDAYQAARRRARGGGVAVLDARIARARAKLAALEAFRKRQAILGAPVPGADPPAATGP